LCSTNSAPGLDAASRANVLRFVNDLAQRGTQIVLSTHRRDEIVPSVSHVLLLEAGHIVQQGPRDAVLARLPQQKAARNGVPTPPIEYSNETLIEIRDADIFREGHHVLHGVNWRMKAGEHWALLGRNGSGKSTFLKLLNGELWAARGAQCRVLA
jgi:molybdate transport system ATP-binding protein